MAQENKDLSQADDLDFNFNIEDTRNLGDRELEDFLEGEEGSMTETAVEKIADDTETAEVIPGAPAKNKPKPKPVDKTKEQSDTLNKSKETEKDFDDFLEEENVDPSKEKSKKPPNTSDSEEDNLEEDGGIKSFAEELYKIGFFSKEADDEEVPSTPEELLEKLEDEKQKGAEQLVYDLAGRHGEDFREAFDAMFVNGVSPKEYLTKFFEIQAFKDLDMTDESNQVRVVEAGLRKQGFDEEDISTELQRLKTNSDLEAVSGKYHKALMKAEEADRGKLEEAAKEQTARLDAMDKQYYNNLNGILGKAIKEKEINGIPVTKELAQKAFNMAYVKRWTLPKSKEEITDLERIFLETKKPENHELRAQMALLFAQTFEGWEPGKKLSIDLSKVQKKAVSSENSELFNTLVKNRKQNGLTAKTGSKSTNEQYSF